MEGNFGSPAGDRMDWNKDTPPHVYHQSSTPFNSDHSPRKRSFDSFADGTEPRDRTEVPASAHNISSDRQNAAFQPGTTSTQNQYIPTHGWDTAFQRNENNVPDHYVPTQRSDAPWQGMQTPIQARGNIPFQGNNPQYAQQANGNNPQQQTTRWNVPVPIQLAILGTFYLAMYTSILAVHTCRAGWQDVRTVGRMVRRRPRIQETVTVLAEVVGTTKRRIISFTHFLPIPNRSDVYQQRTSTSPGRAPTPGATPPRFRPRPHTLAAEEDERRFLEEHQQTIIMPVNDTGLPENLEPLMSGALQDEPMDGILPITPDSVISHSPRPLTLHTIPRTCPESPPRTMPGAYPESPLQYEFAQPLVMPPTVEMVNPELSRPVKSSGIRDEVDAYDTEDAGLDTSEIADGSAINESDLVILDDASVFDWEADSDYEIEPLPDVDPAPPVSDKAQRGGFSELQISSLKSLLATDEARMKQYAVSSPLPIVSNEPKAFVEAAPSRAAASHHIPSSNEATYTVQTEKPSVNYESPAELGLIESNRSPLPAPPTTPGPHGTIDLRRSPLSDFSSQLSDISTPELPSRELSAPGPVSPTTPVHHGSIESTSSPLSSLPTLSPPSPAFYGLIESNRSSLPDATHLRQHDIGLIESNRSPTSSGVVARQADVDWMETSPSSAPTTISPSSTASGGSIESNRSPLPDVTHLRQDDIGLIESNRSPMSSGVVYTRQVDDDWAETSPTPSPLAGKGSRTACMSRPMNLATSAEPKRRSALASTTPAKSSPSKISKVWRFFTYRKQRSPPLGQSIGVANPKTPVKATKKSVGFYESPKTGRPVTGVKRFVMGESISHPSPMSSHDESTLASLSMNSDIDTVEHNQESFSMREQAALDAQLLGELDSQMCGSDNPITIWSDEQSQAGSESNIEPRDLTDSANPTPAADTNSSADEQSSNTDANDGSSGSQPSDSDHNGAASPEFTDKPSDGLTKETDDDVFVDTEPQKAITGSLRTQSPTTPQKAAVPSPTTPAPTLVTEFADLSVSSRRRSIRRLRQEEEAERLRVAREEVAAKEKAQREKEDAEFQAQLDREAEEERIRQEREAEVECLRQEREAEEERIRLGVRRLPKDKIIQPLDGEWEGKVDEAMHKGMGVQLAMTSTGNPITRRDFGKVLPQPGTGDDMAGWLNDEIIAAYLQAVVDYGHTELGHKRGETPKLHAFNAFFYTNLKKAGGYENVRRWARRAKIGGKDLESVEWVFIPVNVGGNHWTLAVVSPIRKTIEYFDSLHGSSAPVVANIRDWLKGELGRAYKPEEWREDEDHYPGQGKGPSQDNAKDCGVFTITTAKMVTLGVDPMAVAAADMPLQRRRIVAELMNGGFSGAFEPRVEFV